MRILLLIIFVLPLGRVLAQNLVINGELENYERIEYAKEAFGNWKEIWIYRSVKDKGVNYLIPGWFNPSGATPDFHQADYCMDTACIGLITSTNQEYREFIQFSLKEPLIEDSVYTVSFWVRSYEKFGEKHYFDPPAIAYCFNVNKRPPTSIYFPTIGKGFKEVELPDSLTNWTKMAFNYRAKGDEKYCTIGNIRQDFDMEGLNNLPGPERFGYLLIDNVEVRRKFPDMELH